MKTFILGDLHGDFDALNIYLQQTPAQTLLICGDFGFWPDLGLDVRAIRNCLADRKITIRFCDGNHEEHPLLRKLMNSEQPYLAVQVADNIFYQPRGSIWVAPDNTRVLFAGGAYSIDNAGREDGKTWFSHLEILQRSDLPATLPEADVVISHTAPNLLPIQRIRRSWHTHWSDAPDPSREVLDTILCEVRPKRWFFGHFHENKSGKNCGCAWQCLAPCHDKRPLAMKQSKIPNLISYALL